MLDVHVALQFHPDWLFGDGLVIERSPVMVATAASSRRERPTVA